MTEWVRQLAALALLLVRHWRRAGIPGARAERFRKGSAFIVRLGAVFLYVSIGRTLGEANLRAAPWGMPSLEWLVAALAGYGVCWGMLTRSRTLRGMAMPLASPLVDTLPVHDGARTTVEFFEVAVAHILTVTVCITTAPALSSAEAGGFGLALSLTATALGAALMRWIGVLASPERVVTATQLSMFAQAVFFGMAFASQLDASRLHPSFLASLARPLAGEGGLGIAFAVLGAVFVVAVVLLAAAERAGYDRGDVVPRKRFVRAERDELTIGGVDELLAQREPGGRRWPFALFGTLALGGLASWLVLESGEQSAAVDAFIPPFFVGWTAWMALSMAAGIASHGVSRDLVARPFLSVLPIEPRQLLDGKIAVVRRRLFIGLLPLAFALLAPLPIELWRGFAWRSAAVATGAFIYASAAVSVAFLTGGAQHARPQPGGTLRLESLLLLMPLGGLILAQGPWTALVPIAALGLVSFEARRAATRVVRWLDDGEDFERETPAWRAAIAFAAFQGTQAVAARLITSWTGDPSTVLGVSYTVSAVVLAALTAYGRRDLAPIRVWPRNPASLPIGLLGGMATAAVARLYTRWLPAPDVDQATLHAGVSLLAVLAIGVLAPVVEELFFRGWLQPVVSRDLPAARKWLAPVLAALAFAAVHPPRSFPIVFAVGLVSGVLYSRQRDGSLGPSVVAHATHNWLVMLSG